MDINVGSRVGVDAFNASGSTTASTGRAREIRSLRRGKTASVGAATVKGLSIAKATATAPISGHASKPNLVRRARHLCRQLHDSIYTMLKVVRPILVEANGLYKSECTRVLAIKGRNHAEWIELQKTRALEHERESQLDEEMASLDSLEDDLVNYKDDLEAFVVEESHRASAKKRLNVDSLSKEYQMDQYGMLEDGFLEEYDEAQQLYDGCNFRIMSCKEEIAKLKETGRLVGCEDFDKEIHRRVETINLCDAYFNKLNSLGYYSDKYVAMVQTKVVQFEKGSRSWKQIDQFIHETFQGRNFSEGNMRRLRKSLLAYSNTMKCHMDMCFNTVISNGTRGFNGVFYRDSVSKGCLVPAFTSIRNPRFMEIYKDNKGAFDAFKKSYEEASAKMGDVLNTLRGQESVLEFVPHLKRKRGSGYTVTSDSSQAGKVRSILKSKGGCVVGRKPQQRRSVRFTNEPHAEVKFTKYIKYLRDVDSEVGVVVAGLVNSVALGSDS